MRTRVVLGVTGSIAAYRAVEIARLLLKRGAEVQAVLTEGATKFVTPLTFEAITGRASRRSVWSLSDDDGGVRKIEHIEDAYAADRILVAPASANFLARYALGMADDALTTTLLSTAAPVYIAPAMETNMWRHPATRANTEVLRARGVRFLGPTDGDLASGRAGEGRMWAPERIVDSIFEAGGLSRDLEGLVVTLTAGPTWEPIDPVRVLTNRSTGAMGIAMAEAAARRGAEVRLVLGPTHLSPSPHPSIQVVRVETAEEMLRAAEAQVVRTDVLIATAAVSDYRPADRRTQKLKRSDPAAQRLELAENPDILATLSRRLRRERPAATVVGFAAETNDIVRHARGKLARKGCDIVIANEVGRALGFGAGQTNVLAVRADGDPQPFGPADKSAVAEFVLDQVVELRRQRKGS